VFKDFQRNGTLSSDWLENNEKRLAESDWDNLYLVYFGYFLRERVTALLESAVKKLIGLSIIKADVLDIQKTQSINL
jgi:uncharacterized NAD(P)/FAD-binding protein YdhS